MIVTVGPPRLGKRWLMRSAIARAAWINYQAGRVVERQPSSLRHLDAHSRLELVDPAASRAREVEDDDLEDPFAPA